MHEPGVSPKRRSSSLGLSPYDVVEGNLDYEGDGGITELPEHLTVNGALQLRGTCLQRLPSYLRVLGDVELEGVETLLSIGNHICIKGSLDVEGCINLRYLPDYLQITGDLFLANSGVRVIPFTIRVSGRIYDLTI